MDNNVVDPSNREAVRNVSNEPSVVVVEEWLRSISRNWIPSFRIVTDVAVMTQIGNDQPMELIRIKPRASASVTEDGQISIDWAIDMSSELTARRVSLQDRQLLPLTGSSLACLCAAGVILALVYQAMRR